MGTHTPPQQLSTAEVASRYYLSVRTVNRYVNEGKLTPAYRFPGMRGAHLFDANHVEAVLGRNNEGSAA